MTEKVRIAVVGAGYWGPNWIRTILASDDAELAYVCDRSEGRLQYVAEKFPGVPRTNDLQHILDDSSVDAVVIATPVATHRPVAEAAFRAGKHVLVEKPLAGTTEDAQAIVSAAEAAGRVLATGHIFAYHPAITALKAVVESGELGDLCYAASDRVNLGPPASEVDVLWDLAVHDLSILMYLTYHLPSEVRTEGRTFVHRRLCDAAFVTLKYESQFVADLRVSWMSPVKIRRFMLVGTKGSATFDDTLAGSQLVISDRGVDSRIGLTASDVKELAYGVGEVRTPVLASVTPLQAECSAFVDAVRSGKPPAADGAAGLAVIQILEAATLSAAQSGAPQRFAGRAAR